ncbi:hypothetical protein Tco_0216908 [Tanacetum coccineum]
MAVLKSCPKHNMVAYLEKTEGNAEFHEVIDFLARSFIHHALTVIAGKPVSISEASIRSDIVFDDADGIDSLLNQLHWMLYSFMGSEGDLTGKHFSGKVTPLFASMLVQSTEDEGATSERPSEPQPTPSPPHPSEANIAPQSDPSPRPSPTPHIPDSIPEVSGRNHGGQSSSDKSLSGNEGDMTLQSVYDLLNEEKEGTEDAVSTKDVVSTDKEKVSTDRSKVSTDRSKDSTDKEEEGTDKDKDSTVSLDEGTDDRTEARSATPITSTTTPTMFGDDETIAQVLLNMSQAKAVSREKEKGVELKDVEETERPRPTSTRSLLTLKPLPKIDPKDKGKKKIEEEDESDTESEDIPEAEKKFKQLARDEEMARKLQEDWETEEERKRIAEEEATKTALSDEYDSLSKNEADRHLASKTSREEESIIKEEDTARYPAKVEVTEQGTKKRKGGHIKMIAWGHIKEEKAKKTVRYGGSTAKLHEKDDWNIVTWRLYEACEVCILEFEDGTVIYMLVERRYPLSKELLQRMLDLGLEVERESIVALDLIRFIKKQIDEE